VEAERALNAINVETANNHRLASEKALEKVTSALDMRTVCIAQMATSIITNSSPHWPGCTAREAVVLAKEILEEVQHPTPEPAKTDEKPLNRFDAATLPIFTPARTAPRKVGWYDKKG
jgi:hypothetical protein